MNNNKMLLFITCTFFSFSALTALGCIFSKILYHIRMLCKKCKINEAVPMNPFSYNARICKNCRDFGWRCYKCGSYKKTRFSKTCVKCGKLDPFPELSTVLH